MKPLPSAVARASAGSASSEPEEASPAPLLHGRVDLDVHGVVGLAAKPRVRVRREEDVRAHLRRIADVVRDELVQARRDLALDEHGKPVHERDDERRDPAQRHPDDERDREQQPEDDREPAPVQVVADDETDRPRRWCSPQAHSCPKSGSPTERSAGRAGARSAVVPRTIARWSSAATSRARRR